MTPSELSRQLREDDTPDLRRRRSIIKLSLFGAAIGGIVSLYQVGVIKHLPDPPLNVFDSDKVDASDYAYKRFATPDAFMMIAQYAATAWLAGAGGTNRAKDAPALPLLLFGKTLVDVVTNLELAREEWNDNKKLCAYCQTATLASIASLVLAWPEAKRALGKASD